MTQQLSIRSYFSLPTDLAGEMRDWPEFVSGEGYSVNLQDTVTSEAVSVRFVAAGEDCYVAISSSLPGQLFDRVVGRVVCALSAHSDNLMVSSKP